MVKVRHKGDNSPQAVIAIVTTVAKKLNETETPARGNR